MKHGGPAQPGRRFFKEIVMKIENPVLPGFNADPSMIRVGDTYYIANSTFEWWPGCTSA